MKLPNELLVQLDGRNFDELSKIAKCVEINWCIERCEMNREEYPESRSYYSRQVSALKRLLVKI